MLPWHIQNTRQNGCESEGQSKIPHYNGLWKLFIHWIIRDPFKNISSLTDWQRYSLSIPFILIFLFNLWSFTAPAVLPFCLKVKLLESWITFLLSFILVLEEKTGIIATQTTGPLSGIVNFIISIKMTDLVFICVCWRNRFFTTSYCICLNEGMNEHKESNQSHSNKCLCHHVSSICLLYYQQLNKQTSRLCFPLLGCSVLFLLLCLAAKAMPLLLSKSCISLKKASSLKRISEISTRRSSPQSFRVRPTNLLRESWSKRRGWNVREAVLCLICLHLYYRT